MRQIIDISYRLGLSHIGSCLTALPIIQEIYSKKKPGDKFVLSQGHCHLTHAIVMEEYGLIKSAEENIKKHGIHCERAGGCDVSTGSLGHGIPLTVGLALANRGRMCYVLTSDGDMAEGSNWEALRIAKEQKLSNLKVYCNCNGYSAYGSVDLDRLEKQIKGFGFPVEMVRTNMDGYPEYLQGLNGHYAIIDTEEKYNELMKCL